MTLSEQDIHRLLSQALSADEAGRTPQAIEHYLAAVEAILRLDDDDLRARLNKFATRSLDRAEELKGVRRPESAPSDSSINGPMPSVLRLSGGFGGNFI